MTDINLLPANQRQKDLLEKQKAFREKQKFSINLTEPVLGYKKQDDLLYIKPKRKNILKIISNIFKRRKAEHKLKNEKDIKPIETVKKSENKINQLGKREIHLMPITIKKERVSDIKKANLNEKNNKILITTQDKEKQVLDKYKKTIYEKQNAEKKNKISYTPGSEIEHGIDVNLIPKSVRKVLIISTKTKISILILILFAISLLTFAVYLWYENQIKAKDGLAFSFKIQNIELKSKIEQLKQEIGPAVSLQYQLIKLDQLLSRHIYFSKLFDYLEKNSIEGIYYSEINFNGIKENTVVLKAVAVDYLKAAEQILIFKDDHDNIIDSEITLISLEKEKLKQGEEEKDRRELVEFSIQLKMRDDFFSGD